MATDDDQAIDRAIASCRILCLTGPESSGKTTLAAALAERFDARLVPEVAREYLAGRDGYDEADVLEIARLQAAAETTALAEGHRLVICDTDLTVIRIWWEDKFGPLPEWLISLIEARAERAYLLLKPDLPWEPDPLRENPQDRDRLFERYEVLLGADAAPYRVVSGSEDQRYQSALAAIDALLPDLELPSP